MFQRLDVIGTIDALCAQLVEQIGFAGGSAACITQHPDGSKALIDGGAE